MLERTKNVLDMLISIEEFDKANRADYANLPDISARYAVVRTAIESITANSITKVSGEKSRAVEQKSVLRLAIRRKMKELARTARGININDIGFQKLFRLPESDNDQLLITTAREFTGKANENKSAFFALGIPENLMDDLAEDVDALEQANLDKTAAQAKTVGATAEIDRQVELAMDAAVIIDIAMKNVYRDNPAKLAEWTSARHIRRKKPSAPKTPPTDNS